MKKTFTMILFAVGTISIAAAQSYGKKDNAYNDNTVGVGAFIFLYQIGSFI